MRKDRYFYVVMGFTVRRWLLPPFQSEHSFALSTDGDFPNYGALIRRVVEEHRKDRMPLERSHSTPMLEFIAELPAQDFSEFVGKGEFLKQKIAKLERQRAEDRARDEAAKASKPSGPRARVGRGRWRKLDA